MDDLELTTADVVATDTFNAVEVDDGPADDVADCDDDAADDDTVEVTKSNSTNEALMPVGGC